MSDTQKSIIGTFLLFPETIAAHGPSLDESWFTGDYRAAFKCLVEKEGMDHVSLASACRVPVATVVSWADAEFSPAFVSTHIENLEKEAAKRRIKYLASRLGKIEELDEANKLIDAFNAANSGADKTEPLHMKSALMLFSKELERKFKLGESLLGATTGITDLDEKTEGLHTGDLVIIAAPSSMGKTALATGIGEAVAMSGKGAVLFFSFEMKVYQLLSRSVASQSRVSMSKIRRPSRFSDADWGRIERAMNDLAAADMYFDDPSGLSLSQILNKIRRFAKKGVKYVFIDYLQIMNYDKDKENTELDIICAGLKGIAKTLDVCVVLLSQLNRGNQKEKRKPTMHDLRGSGTIENHSDVIIMPWRESAYCELCQEGKDTPDHDLKGHQAKAEIIIGKQRQGERNISIPVAWSGEQTRFYNLSRRAE